MRNTRGKEGGENEKSRFWSLLLAASETGCILGERKGKKEGVRKRERGTKREKHEKEGKGKRKLTARETEHIF